MPPDADGDSAGATAEPGATEDAGDSGDSGDGPGFGDLRLDLPGPFGTSWRDSLRSKRRLAVLSRRSRALRPAAVPLVAAAWVAVVGVLAAALLLALSGVPFSAEGVAIVWLAANHVPIDTDAGMLSVLPLGLLLITVLPARRAGRFVARQVADERGRTAGLAAAGCYAAVAAGVAVATAGGPPAAAWLLALLGAGAVALVGGVWGYARERRGRWRPQPLAVSVSLTVAVPLVVGLMLLTALALTNIGPVLAGQQRLATTPLEHVGLILLQLAYLPNLLIWAGAFVIGSGIAVGAGQTLSPFTSGPPVLPDLPVLAATPTGVPTWTALLPLTVAASGALAAMLLARGAGETQVGRRIGRILPIAAGSGVCWALLAWLSAGAIGSDRLAHVGPSIGTGIVAAVIVGVGGVLWAVLPALASDARPRLGGSAAPGGGTRGTDRAPGRKNASPPDADAPGRARRGRTRTATGSGGGARSESQHSQHGRAD